MVWNYFNEHVNILRYPFPQNDDVESEPEWCKINRRIGVENKDRKKQRHEIISTNMSSYFAIYFWKRISRNEAEWCKADRQIGIETKIKHTMV